MKLDKLFQTQSFGKYSSIMESIKFLDKNASSVRIIRGENDLIKYLENNTDNRIVYDIANRWYLVGDIEKYIHDYLLDYACDAGLYYAKNGRDYKINNEKSLVCFVTYGDENESFRFAEDEYTTQYNYSWINVFDRNGTFKKIPLYKALGKPIYEIDISEEGDDEYLDESVSFELTDDEFVLGGKEFHEESEDIQVFNIYNDTVKIGMLAITEYADNSISLDGLKILPKFRKQGFGKQVVDILKKKYKSIYVRSIPSAKKFWQKQGHDAYYNDDSGTYDGDLIYDFDESELYESLIKESISFEPTDDYFAIGGKVFAEENEDCEVYNIYNDGIHIGMLAIEEFPDGINLEGLEIFKEYRKQGFGKKVVDLLKKKYKGIYVRAIPSAKKFWKKQGHKAYYNKNSGTWDGDLIYEESEFISEAVNEYSLYHGCDLAYAVSMIIENRMRGETVANINGKKVQGNSMTRNYNFAKQWQEERWNGSSDVLNQFWVVLELDYNRLKHNHKIVPYNYWEDYFGSEYEHTVDRNGYGNQYEEFAIGTINNLQLYIKDVYLSDECFYTDYDEILNIVKDELNLRGERYSDKQIRIALNKLGIQNGYIDGDELDESIAYVSKKDLSDIILMNPTKRELRDNNIELARYCYDEEGNFYFGNANILTHNDIISSIENKLGITLYDDIGFYNANNNCFYIKGYFADEDEYIEELENAKRKFSSESLLKDLFGNFKVDIFQGETPWD